MKKTFALFVLVLVTLFSGTLFAQNEAVPVEHPAACGACINSPAAMVDAAPAVDSTPIDATTSFADQVRELKVLRTQILTLSWKAQLTDDEKVQLAALQGEQAAKQAAFKAPSGAQIDFQEAPIPTDTAVTQVNPRKCPGKCKQSQGKQGKCKKGKCQGNCPKNLEGKSCPKGKDDCKKNLEGKPCSKGQKCAKGDDCCKSRKHFRHHRHHRHHKNCKCACHKAGTPCDKCQDVTKENCPKCHKQAQMKADCAKGACSPCAPKADTCKPGEDQKGVCAPCGK